MNRKSIVSALVAMALAFPVTGWAESAAEKSPEEKRTEVRGYAEEYKEHADPTVRTAAILALGQTAKREDRAELEALKAADSDRVRLAAGMALVLSEDGKAANFTATLLRDSTTLFVTLRDVISVLPASHQTQIINELLKDATTEIRRDVFRYLAEQRGPLYELLGGSLLDANEEIRAQAIQALRASERSDALAFASTMLGNRTEAIRSDGLRLTDTIRKHPRAAAEVTALLEKALQDRIPAVQLEAARQLVYLKNPKGTAALVDSLEGAPAEDRVRTIRVLLENEVRPPLAPLKPLIESSEDKEEKALLYELAAASRDAEMFATLKTMFSSEDFDERIIAVRSLGRTKNPAAGELLARGLFEGRPEIRRYSARGLGHLESEASLAVLRRAVTQERVKEIRLEAIDAVGRHKTATALQILRFLVTDNDPDIKRHVVLAIRNIGLPEGTQGLEVLSRDRNLDVQWLTFLTILELAPEQGLRLARTALRNPRETFAIDLEPHRLDAKTREAIFELLLTHDNQRVRRAAFGRLGAMGDELLPLFRKLVIDAKTPVDIRGDLVVLLATSRDEADKPLFEGLVSKEASNAIGHRAAWALTQYGDAGLEEAFRAHLATDNPTLRAIAVYGLSRMN